MKLFGSSELSMLVFELYENIRSPQAEILDELHQDWDGAARFERR